MQSEESLTSLESGLATTETKARVSWRDKITPKFVRAARDTYREGGLKAVWKRFGWKLFAAFFLYYLIRDSFLYILLPYLITRGLLF
jgi:hypothetical protein